MRPSRPYSSALKVFEVRYGVEAQAAAGRHKALAVAGVTLSPAKTDKSPVFASEAKQSPEFPRLLLRSSQFSRQGDSASHYILSKEIFCRDHNGNLFFASIASLRFCVETNGFLSARIQDTG